jgi:hypothetical protein
MIAKARKPRATIVNPAQYFKDWHYDIHKSLWSALGVTRREYVDKEKTKAARAAAKMTGHQGPITRIAIRYLAYAVAERPALDFHEGDVFHPRSGDHWLQVISLDDALRIDFVITETNLRTRFNVLPSQFADWLKDGMIRGEKIVHE